MPTYTITAPDGQEYDVTGPGTEQEALAQVQKQHPLASTGQRVVSSVTNPQQSIPDLLRTSSNFITLGLRDRLAPYLGSGRTAEQERAQTSQASTRLGSIDEAANLGMAMFQPSAAAGYVPAATESAIPFAGSVIPWVKSALGWAGEGAGQAGAQAVIEGQDPVAAMERGAAFGAGGKVVGDLAGWAARPAETKLYPDNLSMRDTIATQPRSTYAKALQERLDRVNAARTVQSQGKAGFKQLNESITSRPDRSGFTPESVAKIGEMAKPGAISGGLQNVGSFLSGKGGSGVLSRIPAAAIGFMTGGKSVPAGMGMEAVGSLLSSNKVSPKDVAALQDMIRNPGGGLKTDPATANAVRDYFAKMMVASGRGS